MELTLWRDTVACLPKGRTLFAYGRNQYSSMILRYLLESGYDIACLKKGQFAGLFEKPMIKSFFAGQGALKATPNDLAFLSAEKAELWRLTIGQWGEGKEDWRWNQISRPGYNLVLQLNFTGVHNAEFDKLVSPCAQKLLQYGCHPVSRKHRTLAWARLDFDLNTGEVLIEELQTDYVRCVKWLSSQEKLSRWNKNKLCERHVKKFGGAGEFQKALKTYQDEILSPITKYWEEIMLAAVVEFCVKELGCRSLFMHQFKSGLHIKNIDGTAPPQSLYTKLPRKFCFVQTKTAPKFLGSFQSKKTRSKLNEIGGPGFWHLQL